MMIPHRNAQQFHHIVLFLRTSFYNHGTRHLSTSALPLCQKIPRVVRISDNLDGGYMSYSRHHNPADNENESGALRLRCGEHHALKHLAYM
jgi:hypothetical protein